MSERSTVPGPRILADGSVSFTVWAPRCEEVALRLLDPDIILPMEPDEHGYFGFTTDRACAGSRYFFRTAGGDYPDPASRSQPEGVHGASQVVDFQAVAWSDDAWAPHDLADLVIYELHVGTFTTEGTFAAAARELAGLASLGITAVEVMPIAEFPGSRNWGYDGVALYAADSSYGGPIEFARFVDAAHAAGLSVLLDVVFNHFGPEGNYSGVFGDYTTSRYVSPWGDAVNFDGPGSDQVRTFFYGCVDHWLLDCHVDGFRLDAIHEIHDESAVPFLSELSERVERVGRATGKPRLLIAESGLNDRRVVEPRDRGGRGMDAAWSDDFHHAVHSYLTGETDGYYADFGRIERIPEAVGKGWCLAWEFSRAHNRHHGNDPTSLPRRAFVLCTQNHDQVGNRMLGDRLSSLVGPAADRAAFALLLLAPYVPLIFMGQEYGERRPFLYFVDHTDRDLLDATREGRAREFAAFAAQGTPPDAGSEDTVRRCILDRPRLGDPTVELELTRLLLSLRRAHDCFRPAASGEHEVAPRAWSDGTCVGYRLRGRETSGLVVANLSGEHAELGTGFVTGLEDATGFVPVLSLEADRLVDANSSAAPTVDLTAGARLGPWQVVAAVRPAEESL